jgi:hypothetical protein
MGSWGATDANESKPSFLTEVEKRSAYATTKGWVVPAGGTDNPNADAEVLVAIGDLSGATKLNIADISSLNWAVASFSKADGGAITAVVNYNEEVTVTGVPRVRLTNSRVGNDFNLSYVSGTGTNRLTFSITLAAASATTNATDVLTIGVNAVNHNSGSTIKEKGTATNATITHGAVTKTLTVGT